MHHCTAIYHHSSGVRRVLSATMLALLVSACNLGPDNSPVHMTFSVSLADSLKASVSTGDTMSVFYGVRDLGKFVAASASQTPSFVSERTFHPDSIGTESYSTYLAVYPSAAVHEFADGGVKLSIPSIQHAVAGGFPKAAFPAVGVSPDFDMTMYNVCGAVRFSIDREGVTQVTFNANGGEKIAGLATLRKTPDKNPPFATDLKGEAQSSITVVCDEGFKVGKAYALSVLPCTLENGFTMSFRSDVTTKYSIHSTVSIGRNQAIVVEGCGSEVSFTDLSDLGVYSKTGYDPSPVVCMAGDRSQLSLSISSGSIEMGIMNLGQDATYAKVHINAGRPNPGYIYSGYVITNGTKRTFNALKCIARDDTLIWMENPEDQTGIILPIQQL